MHRYRVNYVLLVGLLVGLVVASGAVYGIWSFQMGRNADTLLARAEAAEDQRDLKEAASLLARYLEFKPDDTDARVKMGQMNVKIAQQALEEQDFRSFFIAKESIGNTLFKFPEEDELRTELVELLMSPGLQQHFAKDALGHIKVLLNKRPEDPELLFKQATCLMHLAQYQESAEVLYKVVGYDPASDSFNQSQALAADDINAFRFLTQLLHFRLERRELALRLQEYMIETHPDSADAYLARGRYLRQVDEGEGGRNNYGEQATADFQQAYELDPQSPDVLLALAADAQSKEDFDQTRKFLEEGLALGTDNRLFYSGLAQMERVKRDLPAALKWIEKGLATVDQKQRPWLLIDKIEIQIDSQDVSGARASMVQFEKEVGRRLPQLDFFEARLLTAEGEWYKAANMLEDVRPKLVTDQRMRVQIDLLRGLAYKSLGQPDKAIAAFEDVLLADPLNRIAIGQLQELEQRYRPTSVAEASLDASSVTERLTAILSQPEEQQDWPAFNAWVEQQFEENETPPVQRKLFRAQVFASRKMYDEAQQILLEAYKEAPDNLGVQRAAYRLVAMDPDGGPEKALALLDRTIAGEKFGDQPMLRLDRADLLLAIDREAAVPELMKLTEGLDDWEVSQKVHVLNGIAERLNSAGKREEAEQVWQRVVDLDPDNLATLMELFNLALAQNDDEGMARAQERILKLVGSKNDSNWAFTDAARLLSRYRRGLEDDTAPARINRLINTVLEQRPDWSNPYLLRATLAMHEQRYLDAEADYAQGLALGRGNPSAISQYARLLIAQGKFEAARQALEPYALSARLLLLGDLYAEILLRTGNLADAAEAAQRIAMSQERNPQVQLWYGQFLQRVAGAAAAQGDAGKDLQETSLAKAGQALSSVVEINPGDPTGWLAWITYLLTSGEREQAEDAIRDAQLQLDEDLQPLFLARAYEMLGRWFDAENLYRLTHDRNPQNTQLARWMAEFYLSQRYPLPDGQRKATLLVNDLLKRAAEDGSAVSRSDATWARRTAARMLAATGDYQNTLQAEKLLASNSVDGALGTEDKLEMATILSQRPDPVSRRKAINLLEEVAAGQPLSDNIALMLGQLYFKDGNWPKARDQMIGLISRSPDSFAARSAYIRMLLDRGGRGDLNTASTHMRRLIEIAPNAPATYELMSLVYSKSDKMDEARESVMRMVPRNLSQLDQNGVRLVQRVAALLTSLNALDDAEKYYRLLAEREGGTTNDALMLAQFLGMHRDPAQGFELLQSLSSEVDLLSIIEVSKRILFVQREHVGDEFDDLMETWITRALREDPESIPLLMSKAEFRDLQRRHEEVASLYRQLLAREDAAKQVRAVILNNLAYLIALQAVEPQERDEAIKLIREAISILGPIADILDTRAVVWMGRGEYQAALNDLELAVIDKPTASKYFHKALAHLGLEQRSEALKAWEKAQELNLEREELNQLERQQYDNLEAQMGRLKTQQSSL